MISCSQRPRRVPARKHSACRVRIGMMTAALLLFVGALAEAQPPQLPDTAVPRREAFSMGLDEFTIGGVLATRPDTSEMYGAVWNFLRTIGVTMVEIREPSFNDLDSLIIMADPARNERVVPNIGPISMAGLGREVILFPFDSAQNFYYQSVFVDHAAGVSDYNQTMDSLQERRYSIANAQANQVVASQIAFGYQPGQHRYPVNGCDPDVVNSSLFVYPQVSTLHPETFHIIVAGHLFQNGTASPNDSVLTVEVWNEVPQGTTYRDSTGGTRTATAGNMEFLYASFQIRKRSLLPPNPNPTQAQFNTYRDTVIAFNMDHFTGSMGGPRNGANSAHRFDIRVRWTGVEPVALRSVTLRDSTAQLVMGNDAAAIAFRRQMLDLAHRIVYGPGVTAPFDTALRRRPLVRFYTGDEGKFFEHGAYNTIDTMLQHDPALAGVRADRANKQNYFAIQHMLDDQPEIEVETYEENAWNRSVRCGGPHGTGMRDFYGLDTGDVQLPSIAEHNGGVYMIPLMEATPQDVERYNNVWQRSYVGASHQGPYDPNFYNGFATELGRGAWSSRRTGKRLICWPGVHTTLQSMPQWDDTGAYCGQNIVVTHIPEAAEVRAMVTLSLAYGARGVRYSWLGSDTQEVISVAPPVPAIDNRTQWMFSNDFGPVGPMTTWNQDRLPAWVMRHWDRTMNPRPTETFVNPLGWFYTGWGSRQAELQWLADWLPRVGAAMAHLQWRDGWSMHFVDTARWMSSLSCSTGPQTRVRAYDTTGNIVREIRSVSRTGLTDSITGTFVELGLFDTQASRDGSGTPNPLLDTNHIFVVNRRVFERGRDIDPLSPRGRLMDSLAETRTLKIRFNMRHPAPDAYNFLHVEELEPDTSPLPLAVAPRRGLDTVVFADSVIALTLRPGGGALLRITYCNPNEHNDTGDLRYASQRKIVFDGRYYHMTYFRKINYWLPTAKLLPTQGDQVFYSRSLPTDANTGAIRWDPRKEFSDVLVSDTNGCHYGQRFPSLTVRADSSRLGDTVVTIVWTAHSCVDPNSFDVLTRNLFVNGNTAPTLTGIDLVGTTVGLTDTMSGVPVVSRLHGGELFAWGDFNGGIVARVRTHDSVPNWWRLPGKYSVVSDVTSPITSTYNAAGYYPTMPAAAHVRGRDSSVGLAWEQPVASGGTVIMYERLVHTVSNGADTVVGINPMMISQGTNRHRFPSLDMTQDVWAGAQEGVTWQSYSPPVKQASNMLYRTNVHFSSLWTETSRACDPDTSHHTWRPYFDCIEPTWQWTYRTFKAAELVNNPNYVNVYPNTASLNARIDPAHLSDSIYFSVVLTRTASTPMRQAAMKYAENYLWPLPKPYLYGGYYPNGSASGVRQHTFETMLYQKSSPGAGLLETSRQFFAKERPTGYMASGRQVHLRVSEQRATAFSCGLHDVWFASDGTSGALPLVARRSGDDRTDSLVQVDRLMRTGVFETHDSTVIGYELMGLLHGDTASARGMRVTAVAELMNAETDLPVAVLDSFGIEQGSDAFAVQSEHTLDLLSGRYYVRLRIVPESMRVDTVSYASLYPVEELASWVEEPVRAKFRAGSATAGLSARARIAVQPNPVTSTARLLYSVSGESTASIVVRDAAGRAVATPLAPSLTSEGRYVLDLDTRGIAAGTYLVELRAGTARAVTKMVVVR